MPISESYHPKCELVDSHLGKREVDSGGSPVAGSRMDTSKAYSGVPGLLQKAINENDTAAWAEIVKKIDYIYSNYGSQSPESINFQSLYGAAFQYADKTRNGGAYTGSTDQLISNPDSIKNYLQAVSNGGDPLNFTLYVPAGYGSLKARRIPNVEETANPGKVFTAHFGSGVEVW